jgi:hypothetical protein
MLLCVCACGRPAGSFAHLDHLLGHRWCDVHAALIALMRHGSIASCQVSCCLVSRFGACPAQRKQCGAMLWIACHTCSSAGVAGFMVPRMPLRVAAHVLQVACADCQSCPSCCPMQCAMRVQAAHLRLDSSSSPLIGRRPPSNTTTGSRPLVRSSCMREMK